MTREGQIKNYAINNCIQDDIDDTSYKLIIETAEWADETMLDKACEWLENMDFAFEYQYSEDGFVFFDKEKLINDFRKAMEE